MRTLLIASLLLTAAPALADETAGTILAFDRVAKVIVLEDKSIWPVGEATAFSADLVAGDKVTIVYVGGGNAGVASITSILRNDGKAEPEAGRPRLLSPDPRPKLRAMGNALRLSTLCLAALPAWADVPIAWHPRAAELCLAPPYLGTETEAQRALGELVAAIEALSPGDDPLLATLAAHGTAICLEDRPSPARGAFNVDRNLVALRADLDFGERLLILIHELRHIDQYGRGFCPSTEVDLHEMERFTYIVEADAQAIATYYAWKLREAGRLEAWEAIGQLREYADIGAVFADAIEDGATPELAVVAAFDAWFSSRWRVETYRLSACSAYLDRLDETKRLRSYADLPGDYFDTLCRLPDGTGYDCRPPK